MGRKKDTTPAAQRKKEKKEERHPASDVTIRVPPIPEPKSPV